VSRPPLGRQRLGEFGPRRQRAADPAEQLVMLGQDADEVFRNIPTVWAVVAERSRFRARPQAHVDRRLGPGEDKSHSGSQG